MIGMMILLMIVAVLCFTVIAVCAMVMFHNRPTDAMKAKGRLEVEQIKTAIEREKWMQDWVLDQRSKSEQPSLPPGTQTVEPAPKSKTVAGGPYNDKSGWNVYEEKKRY